MKWLVKTWRDLKTLIILKAPTTILPFEGVGSDKILWRRIIRGPIGGMGQGPTNKTCIPRLCALYFQLIWDNTMIGSGWGQTEIGYHASAIFWWFILDNNPYLKRFLFSTLSSTTLQKWVDAHASWLKVALASKDRLKLEFNIYILSNQNFVLLPRFGYNLIRNDFIELAKLGWKHFTDLHFYKYFNPQWMSSVRLWSCWSFKIDEKHALYDTP